MQSDISIVPIASEHAEGYRECIDVIARERKHIGMVEAPVIEVVQGWVADAICKKSPYFVAVTDGQVVAWCCVIRGERVGFTHSGGLSMGVHPAWRRMGLGRQLLDAAVCESWAIGLERIDLQVLLSNEPAVSLYRSAGFRTEGVKRRARLLDGAYEDILIMALLRPE